MGRSIAAVVIGFVVIGALAFGADAILRATVPGAFTANGRMEDPAMLLFVLGYVTLFAVAGCYLTARLAPRRPMAHALVLGLLGLCFNVVGTMAQWDHAPAWYHVLALALVMPSAWLGGWLRERELRRGGEGTRPVTA
jgi:hypothetical protein